MAQKYKHPRNLHTGTVKKGWEDRLAINYHGGYSRFKTSHTRCSGKFIRDLWFWHALSKTQVKDCILKLRGLKLEQSAGLYEAIKGS